MQISAREVEFEIQFMAQIHVMRFNKICFCFVEVFIANHFVYN